MKRNIRNVLGLLVCFVYCGIVFASEVNYDQILTEIYQEVKDNNSGKVADYIPALGKANPENYGIVIATVNGDIYKTGKSDIPFAIESISKVFTLALALQDSGKKAILDNAGAYQTGLPFNSIIAADVRAIALQNPLVNAGAIITTSYIAGSDSGVKWERTLEFLSKFAGKKLNIIQDVYDSEMKTNQHNIALAWQAKSFGYLRGDPDDAVTRYTKACSVGITCEDLARMGAILANGGVNPFTGEQFLAEGKVPFILSMMMISGMYDSSGPWLLKVGIPGKSGVGGGILAIVPNRFALAVYSPPLDKFGNSVRGIATAELLSEKMGLHLLMNK